MLLHLKQMTGRLIRGESDRGVVVIIDARPDKRYFRELEKAFPLGTRILVGDRFRLPGLLAEIGLGADGRPGDDPSFP